jgi:hypothetical protein
MTWELNESQHLVRPGAIGEGHFRLRTRTRTTTTTRVSSDQGGGGSGVRRRRRRSTKATKVYKAESPVWKMMHNR